jgi:1-aminocyclopropane-1-carboxylate deaminase/D-cysteine desulfhydrase-like pyridoxal-dependent ACC family enzyme
VRALFRRFPRAAAGLAWVPLAELPTPVERLPGLGAAAAGGRGAELWVKREDRTGTLYGGNKVRKLELLIGAARARGARHLVTTGGLGSNHAVATALYGARFGLATTALLVPQPLTPGVVEVVRRNLRAMAAAGARMVLCASWSEIAARAAALLVTETDLWPPAPPRFVWPGGSSPAGVLGYVDAALELAEQVRAGALPEPELHVVAAGTGGTVAGLLAGLHVAGLGGEVVGVRVVEPPFAGERAIAWLARAAMRRVARAAGVALPPLPDAARARVLDGFMGDCYGAETEAAADAVRRAAALDGLVLDPIYTGKAVAAVLAEPRFAGRRVLLWHTKSSADLAPLLARCPDPTALPRAFHRFFSSP